MTEERLAEILNMPIEDRPALRMVYHSRYASREFINEFDPTEEWEWHTNTRIVKKNVSKFLSKYAPTASSIKKWQVDIYDFQYDKYEEVAIDAADIIRRQGG